MSEMSEIWRKSFATWPVTFRRKGVVVPVGGEPIPFCDFVMSESLLVLERPTPDNSGARRVAIPFDRIHNVKYVEPLKTDQFLKAGFVTEMKVDLPRETQARPTAAASAARAANPKVSNASPARPKPQPGPPVAAQANPNIAPTQAVGLNQTAAPPTQTP